jgi:hypothetical protein
VTFREFCQLSACTGELIAAVFTANRDGLDAVQAKVESIHAQIDARKAAARKE